MRKTLSLFALSLTLALSLGANDAEAKRLGGAKSFGMQRQATPPAKAPDAAPAPAPTAAAPATANPAAAAQPKRSWMGPVAGLAAGLGLAALASHFGFGEELASMLLIGLLVVGGLALVSFLMRRGSATQRPAMAGSYAGSTAGSPSPATRAAFTPAAGQAMPGSVADSFARPGGSAAAHPAAESPRIPADFDAVAFARTAKVNFIRLQAANDAGDLDDLRAFTTPEMFAELSIDLADRGSAAQHTEVVDIDAEVIEAVEEGSRYVVSVRFRGQLREAKDAPLESVDEVWHLTKPRQGRGGWLLAGIQQLQ
jgi:predicted lipid-binding transport protein (Tim44 family)